MSVKHELDKTVSDVKDATKEGLHRGAADAEKMRRETEGDEMTSSEKLESMANEAKDRTEAAADHAKRTIRDHT